MNNEIGIIKEIQYNKNNILKYQMIFNDYLLYYIFNII